MATSFDCFRQRVDKIENWYVVDDASDTVWLKRTKDHEKTFCFAYLERETVSFLQATQLPIKNPFVIGFQETHDRECDVIELDFLLGNHRFQIKADVSEVEKTNWIDIEFFMLDTMDMEWTFFFPHTVTQKVKKELCMVCNHFKEVLSSMHRFRLLFETGNVRFNIEDDRWMQYI